MQKPSEIEPQKQYPILRRIQQVLRIIVVPAVGVVTAALGFTGHTTLVLNSLMLFLVTVGVFGLVTTLLHRP